MKGRTICAAACVIVATATMAEPGLTLATVRKMIVAERAKIWVDPYSIRDAKITALHACPEHALGGVKVPSTDVICVCVEANAKNPMGGYTGIAKTRILISRRKLLDSQGPLAGPVPDYCGKFQPFPELGK